MVFSRPGKKKFDGAHVTYKQKKLKQQRKKLNMGKGTHVMYEDDGTVIDLKDSKVLSKVKTFLEQAKDLESVQHKIAGDTDGNKDSQAKSESDKSLVNSADTESTGEVGDPGRKGVAETKRETDQKPAALAKPSQKSVRKNKKSRKRRAKQATSVPEDVQQDATVMKYWCQRYRLFSKFDLGIRMDRGISSLILIFITHSKSSINI